MWLGLLTVIQNMEKCDICNISSSETVCKHKNKVHSVPANFNIRQPYNEMSNEEIATRYLNRQKVKLDKDKYNKLKLKIKGLKRFRPKPCGRKTSQTSKDEVSIINMKETPKPSTSKRYLSNNDKEVLPYKIRRFTKKCYQCSICKNKFENRSVLSLHSAQHSKCPYCGKRFADLATYLRHRKTNHQNTIRPSYSEQLSITNGDTLSETSSADVETPLPPSSLPESEDDIPLLSSPPPHLSESEDKDSNVDDSDEDELKRRDNMSKEHINCVTVERFIYVRKLIRNNDFDTLTRDTNLIHTLQVIINGVLKGFIPICSSQRMLLTPELKSLMQRFSRYANPRMVLEHRDNLKLLFEILGKSVKFVVDSFNKFGI